MTEMSAGRAVVELSKAKGVRHAFGIVGSTFLDETAFDAVPVKPQRVYAELRRVLPPDAIVTLDAGAAPAYGYDRLQFLRPRTFLTPLDLGGLGFAFPAALGAKLGRPGAPALAIHGDGGLLMNAQELETAVRHGIAAVALVLNNNCWGSEKAYQRHFYGARYVGVDIGNPRFDRYAERPMSRATHSGTSSGCWTANLSRPQTWYRSSRSVGARPAAAVVSCRRSARAA
jgi:acetolactate synthase-1/2/3 large subunit/sulfoacetaldehyde acetyltransferase